MYHLFIFYEYISAHKLHKNPRNQLALQRVQGRFKKLRYHIPATGGKDVQKYIVSGDEKTSTVTGWLIKFELFWTEEESRPKPNKAFQSISKSIKPHEKKQ